MDSWIPLNEHEKVIRKMILDVGCGDNPKGDINTDLYLYSKQIGSQDKAIKTKADIIADGNYLPFRDKTFNKVISHHVIEHTKTPFQFLKELVRVAESKVELKCPHRYSKQAKMPYHISYFNRTWLVNACAKLGIDKHYYTISTSYYHLSLFLFAIPILLPDELTLTINLK